MKRRRRPELFVDTGRGMGQKVGTGKLESASEGPTGHVAMPQSHQDCIRHIKVGGMIIYVLLAALGMDPCLLTRVDYS